MSPALEFRRVGPGLEGPLARFFAAFRRSKDRRRFEPHPMTAAHARALCRYKGKDLYYVAVAGGRVLGYGILRGWDEGYARPSLGIGLLPEAQGRGIGRALMHFLHAAAAARGARQVRLRVAKDNRAARALYRGLGYRFRPNTAELLEGIVDVGR